VELLLFKLCWRIGEKILDQVGLDGLVLLIKVINQQLTFSIRLLIGKRAQIIQ
jgi:hypothetical protein